MGQWGKKSREKEARRDPYERRARDTRVRSGSAVSVTLANAHALWNAILATAATNDRPMTPRELARSLHRSFPSSRSSHFQAGAERQRQRALAPVFLV